MAYCQDHVSLEIFKWKIKKINIMRIIILIPVWGRLEITRICYQALVRSIQFVKDNYNIELMPIIISSEPDHTDLAMEFDFSVMEAPNDSVSDKLNAGLEMALCHESEYITLLGSDNVLLDSIWKVVMQEIHNDTYFFGFSEIKFIKYDSGEHMYAQYPCTTGVARFHKTAILREIAFIYKVEILTSYMSADGSHHAGQIVTVNKVNGLMHILESRIGIWTPGMMTGMDNDSERFINQHGHQIASLPGCHIIDYKSDINLTTWDEIANNITIIEHADNQ
jgi:hypothetical protein